MIEDDEKPVIEGIDIINSESLQDKKIPHRYIPLFNDDIVQFQYRVKGND